MSSYADRLDALEQTWSEWVRIGAGLTAADWRRPTRCVPWQVAQLYAHHSSFPVALGSTVTSDAEAVPVTAVEVLRGFNAPGGNAHTMASAVVDHAVQVAADHAPAELVERFAVTGARTLAELRAADPAHAMPWPDRLVPLIEVVRIAVLEATVHLLDLQRALDQPPAVPEAALQETVSLLAAIAPAVEFIESATGRAPATTPLPVIR